MPAAHPCHRRCCEYPPDACLLVSPKPVALRLRSSADLQPDRTHVPGPVQAETTAGARAASDYVPARVVLLTSVSWSCPAGRAGCRHCVLYGACCARWLGERMGAEWWE